MPSTSRTSPKPARPAAARRLAALLAALALAPGLVACGEESADDVIEDTPTGEGFHGPLEDARDDTTEQFDTNGDVEDDTGDDAGGDAGG